MARPKQTIPERPALGAVFLSIVRGNKREADIVRDLGRRQQTISEQLGYLEQGGWIKRDKKTKEYSINYDKLINYYSEKFKMSKKILKENIKTWLAQIAATTEQISLDGIGTQLVFVVTIYEIATGQMPLDDAFKLTEKRLRIPGLADAIKKSGFKRRELK